MEQYIKNIFGNNIQNFIIHDDNIKYYGCEFEYQNKYICFRKCKVTQKKPGFFVTLWKKINNINIPYNIYDKYHIYIFYIETKNSKGIFKFPKSVLINNGILQNNLNKGKMGFRIYAPWNNKLNNTAINTQQWQSQFYTKL